MLQILAERQFPIKSLKLLASPRSAGRKVEFNNQEYVIEAVSQTSLQMRYCLLPLADASKQWAPVAIEADVQLLTTRVLFA